MNESAENFQTELEALQAAVDSVQTEGGDYSLPYICWRANIPADTLLRTPALINYLCSALGISSEQFMIDELLSLYYRTLQLEEQVQQLSTNLQLEPEAYAANQAYDQSYAGTAIWAPAESQALPAYSRQDLSVENMLPAVDSLLPSLEETGNAQAMSVQDAEAAQDMDIAVAAAESSLNESVPDPGVSLEQISSVWTPGLADVADGKESSIEEAAKEQEVLPAEDMDPFTAKLMAALQAEATGFEVEPQVLSEPDAAVHQDYMSLDLLDMAIRGELPGGGAEPTELADVPVFLHQPEKNELDTSLVFPAEQLPEDIGSEVDYLDDLLATSEDPSFPLEKEMGEAGAGELSEASEADFAENPELTENSEFADDSGFTDDSQLEDSESEGVEPEDSELADPDSGEESGSGYSADELRDLYTQTLNKEEQKEERKEKLKNSSPLKKFVGGNKASAETAAAAGPRVVPPDVRKSCLMLGIKPEDVTSKGAVLEAWKHEMAKPGVHPDTGGDTEMAIYLNTAKDTLIRWLETKDPKLGKKFGNQAAREPQSK